MEKQIEAARRRLSEILGNLPQDPAEIIPQMTAAALLVCHIKRRFQFFFMEMDGQRTVLAEEFAVFANELAEIAKLGGMNCLTAFGLMGEIPIRRAVLFFDFFEFVLEYAAKRRFDNVFANMPSENGGTALKILLPRGALDCEMEGELIKAVRAENGIIELTDLHNIAGFCLSFPAAEQKRAGALLCRTEELIRLKSRVHDQMGQKLSVLMHFLRQGQWPKTFFSSFCADLSGGLKQIGELSEPLIDPEPELQELAAFFEHISGRLEITGEFPKDRVIFFVLVQILREAATNAVIHGGADTVRAEITREKGNIKMKITDSGSEAPGHITERGGISGMRRNLEKIGGRLDVELTPGFALNVTIPILPVF
ncbi:MAG: hypothetical protein FWD23_11530 [Oscillospiraceae bacterium]|nr:hypothetical protein [Oscillospiraceae bacterium]